MAIACPRAKIQFFPIPKVACTSIKVMIYEINNDLEWQRGRIAFGQVHAYSGYGSLPFAKKNLPDLGDYVPVAVIRNPVERALSAYRDKARSQVLAGTKSETLLRRAGLPMDPDPELFFEEIEQYFEYAPVIREHMRPFRYHLGDDLGYYKKIVKLEEMQKLSSYFSDALGWQVAPKSTNSSRKSVNADKVVSEKTLNKIMDYCQDDIEFLKDYYTV